MRALVAVAGLAVLLSGCSSADPTVSAPSSSPSSSAPAVGSDDDLPLPAASSVPPVEGVPAARLSALRDELRSVWGVPLVVDDGTLRGSGADPGTGMRFGIRGSVRTDSTIRGYACTAAPSTGTFPPPAETAEPAPAELAAMETALGFLQTCANSSAADPDRATVWVRAVAQQVLAGTPAERRIGGVLFRLERSSAGLRLTVGSL